MVQNLFPHQMPPQGARHSTTAQMTSYLGPSGRLMGNTQSRGWVHQTVRQWLRVARRPEEIARVMRVWRQIHYLAKPERGNHHDPIGRETIRLHYCLNMPALRVPPAPWFPAAAITIRYCLPGGIPAPLGLESPLQALEIARNFVADDVREIRDMSPEILREVVRRIRAGDDWASVVKGRVLWKPQWLLSFSDPGVGHDGGLYRGAGAEYLGARSGGKDVWGWPLT
ncbi:MAG: hypothetical protein Q8R28_22640 [Dehalococcoidia bacterium]|nr:hypothetical protein [Dehalococcoidia bacterium]